MQLSSEKQIVHIAKIATKTLYKKLAILLLLLFWQDLSHAQTPLPAYIDSNGDTLGVVFLKEVQIFSKKHFKSAKDQRRYDKLYRNVLAVYPYAKEAGKRIAELDKKLQSIPDAKTKKIYTKLYEKQLKEEFTEDLKNMTISQGKLLIKLIDRETSRTSYELIKEFRGGFQAFMWQNLASLFGTNLKTAYDREEDRDIEEIIMLIEMGAVD